MRDRFVKEALDRLFAPRHVAVIGATDNMTKWGGMILANIITNEYKGTIYPVNLNKQRVLEIPTYPSVSKLPVVVDLACIVTPASTVPSLIRECGQKGIRTVLVISSDFSETGPEGRQREESLANEARACNIGLIGPNSMGVFSAPMSLVCMMALLEPLQGDISFVSQSGNIGVHMMAWGKMLNAGFRHFISSGNEACTTCQEYLEYFGDDPECRAVMVYMESVKGSIPFVERAREVAKNKPVIVFKGGKTDSGQKAAASHSGALAGTAALFDGAFVQAGLIQARTTEEFIDCARTVSRLPLPSGNRVAIITRGGGWGVIAADACEQQGLVIAGLEPKTIQALDRLLPPYWSRGNPVDMVAVTNIEVFLACTEALMQDRNVDGLIALSALPDRVFTFLRKPALKKAIGMDESQIKRTEELVLEASEKIIEGIIGLMRTFRKPVVMVGGRIASEKVQGVLDREGLSMFPTPERAVRVMSRLMEYASFRKNIERDAR